MTPEDRDDLYNSIDTRLKQWRQGDVAFPKIDFAHWADLSKPITDVSTAYAQEADHPKEKDLVIAFSAIEGVVVLSQTCDIVRDCKIRQYVEIAPLVSVDNDTLESVRKSLRPQFALIPRLISKNLVADLDRTMTVEKSVIAEWDRIPGWETDEEIRTFALALNRKRSRFAFPDDFVKQAGKMQNYLKDKHGKEHTEGACLESLRQIRVRAAPSWDSDDVKLTFWFVKEAGMDKAEWFTVWPTLIEKWTKLFKQEGRFSVEAAVVTQLEDMKAIDYVESDPLDLDYLSQPE
jgi:hypothetical protein